MLVLLSPAKNMNFEQRGVPVKPTKPLLQGQANALAEVMRRQTARDLSRLMGISDKLAELNTARFQAFEPTPKSDLTHPAIFAFNGDVYQGLEAHNLSEDDIAYAQDHLRILSGLYGVLRPLDAIQPYRLEMGTKLLTERGSSLYDYWGDAPAKLLRKDLKKQKSPVVINLASDEYFSVIDKKALNAPIITPNFKEVKDDKARTLSFYLKRARGMMAKWIIQNRIETPEELKKFKEGGYRFDAEASTNDKLIFYRPQPKPKK
jgi:uncharacterized protein